MDTSNDESARMKAIVTEHYAIVKRFCRSKLPEPDCYDRAHEVIRAFLAIDPERIAHIGNPKAFLLGIARNHVLKHFQALRPTNEFDSTRMSVAQLGTSLSVQINRRNLLANALRSLPLEEQIAFEWHYGEDLTIEQVAEQLGVSRATATRRISAARTKLREFLGAATEDLSPDDIEQLTAAYRAS